MSDPPAPVRSLLRCLLLLLASIPALPGCEPAPSGPPNLILVIGDDHGYPDFGFMGSEVVKTPRLDALAEEGVVFTHGYSTASVCRPALLTLLTGLEPLQFRLREPILHKRLRNEPGSRQPIEAVATLPRLLAERGYATFQSGKHWEGHYSLAGFQEGTVEKEAFEGGLQQSGMLVREGMEREIAFMERNRDRPFFLWFAPLLPHIPFNAPPKYHVLYSELRGIDRGYYANIAWFDDGLGQLVDAVRELGLERDTLFVYVVDNGWHNELPEDPELGVLGGPKGKLSLHELGFRSPVLLRWVGGIEPAPHRDELVSFTDVFVTLLDYAGVEAPEDRIGHSLRPLLEEGADWPREDISGWVPTLRGRGRGMQAGGFFWRDRRWHYLQPTGSEPSLYDLAADPQETRDVKDEHPEVLARAQERVRAWSTRFESGARR